MQNGDNQLNEHNKMISPCPKSPNCVSSLEKGTRHSVEPIEFSGSLSDSRERILKLLSETKRARVVSSTENYIQAEFTSSLFRFVDDVEFFFDDHKKVIHVRSASRIGYYDFGVNRRRIENIRDRFNQGNNRDNNQ